MSLHSRFGKSVCVVVPFLLAVSCFVAGVSADPWQRLGPDGGQVISMTVAVDGTVYLGTPDGHVFASADRGSRWDLRGRAGGRLDGVIQSLINDTRNPNGLYAGIWYLDPSAGGGVFQTSDGGRTWHPAGLAGEAVRALRQSDVNPSLLVAGTRNGVFRTIDGGTGWERISPAGNIDLRNVDSLAIGPKNPNVIYAGTYHLPWKTIDGGRNWFPIHSGMIDDSDVMSLQIDRDDLATVFASACSGIYRSGDGGSSWTKLQGIPFSSRRTQQILQDSEASRMWYAATTEGLWLSNDGGENWSRVTPRDWVVNAVVSVRSAGGSRILIGTESRGVLVSDDGGKTFYNANVGFSHRVIASMAVDPKAFGHFLVQLGDSSRALLETRDAGRTWSRLPGVPPTGEVADLIGTSAGWWATLRNGGALRYDSRLRRWTAVRFMSRRPRAGESRAVAPPRVLRVAEGAAQVYVATTDGVWMTGSEPAILRPFESNQLFGSVQDFSLGPQTCALAKKRITCAGNSLNAWETLPPPRGVDSFSWIKSVQHGPADSVYLGTSRGVFRWNGTMPAAWRLVQSGLPALASQPPVVSGKALAIAAANGGFYVSGDGGKTWTRTDTPAETGAIVNLYGDGHGGFEVASRSEGVLHWAPATQ